MFYRITVLTQVMYSIPELLRWFGSLLCTLYYHTFDIHENYVNFGFKKFANASPWPLPNHRYPPSGVGIDSGFLPRLRIVGLVVRAIFYSDWSNLNISPKKKPRGGPRGALSGPTFARPWIRSLSGRWLKWTESEKKSPDDLSGRPLKSSATV